MDDNCWLIPFLDITPDDPGFQSVQRVSWCGILKGELISKGWANEMRFHPNDFLTIEDIEIAKKRLAKFEDKFSRGQKVEWLPSSVIENKITRKEFAVFIDQKFDPFKLPV